jgi:HD-GYP domain-containing protein (c-di-GMP phosphodiesterase class II)
MINVLDIRTYDDYTYAHSLNVAILATVIGKVLGLSRQSLYELAMAAVLHDTGKMFIDKKILNKPGKLTPDEFSEIKKHCALGFNFLSQNLNIVETCKTTALQHHEAYDGNGYPSGLSGNDIHLFGRIVCVADVYDALTSDRPYHKAMLPSDAIEFIMSEYNSKFDPEIVDAMIKKIAPYPLGTCVKLSNGLDAIVVKNYESSSLRPVLKIINSSPEVFIDLTHDRSALKITIEKIINY